MSADSGRQLFALADIKRFWVLIAAAAFLWWTSIRKKFSNPDLKFPPKERKNRESIFEVVEKKNSGANESRFGNFAKARKHLPKTTENFESWIDLVKKQNKTKQGLWWQMKGDKRIGNGRGSRKKESEQQSLDERHFFLPSLWRIVDEMIFCIFYSRRKKDSSGSRII